MCWARAEESLGVGDFDCPEDDIELRREAWGNEVRAGGEAAVEFEGGFVAGFEVLGEGAAASVGEELLRGPESDGGGSGAGTLERDLAEVKIFGGEVGVRGVVFVEAADGGIAEEDAAAAVGLKAVLVRVDDDGVGLRDGVEGGAGFGARDCRRG